MGEVDCSSSMIRDYLRLVRIQSVPLTLSIMLVGYAMSTGTIFTVDGVYLFVVGTLSHTGFYSMNEVLDREWDAKQGEEMKPLVSGDIEVGRAMAVFASLTISSILLAGLVFELSAFAAFTIACVLGAEYNIKSKKSSLSALYLSGWSVAILMTGYLQGV